MFNNIFFSKTLLLRDNVENYNTVGQATSDITEHAIFMLDN